MDNLKKILITGTAGFIGFHLAKFFLEKKWEVIGIDGLTDYYDIQLKLDRHKILNKFKNFKKFEFMLQDYNKLNDLFMSEKPKVVIHLAAQAGVRYSFKNPSSYIDTNIVGTFNILETVKNLKLKHLIISSTSSVYGDSHNLPFHENEITNYPLSLYAATKKSCEVLAHSYSCSYKIPITLVRFFTVYGPWGRPDMALFKFTDSIIKNEPIEIFNHGHLKRDFTYIDDIVNGVYEISKLSPEIGSKKINLVESMPNSTPYRIVNIGSSRPTELLTFIELIEKNLGIKANKKFVKHQMGDVKSTWSDISLINHLTKFKPKISLEKGINNFMKWYREYYKI